MIKGKSVGFYSTTSLLDKYEQDHIKNLQKKDKLRELKEDCIITTECRKGCAKYEADLEGIRQNFFYPWQNEEKDDYLKDNIKDTLDLLTGLKPKRTVEEVERSFLGKTFSSPSIHDYERRVESEVIEVEGKSLEEVINEDLLPIANGFFLANHPLYGMNVLPPTNFSSVIATLITSLLNPNLVEDEYSLDFSKAEISVASMMSKLANWQPMKNPCYEPIVDEETGEVLNPTDSGSGGLFTFSGLGCYLYGVRYTSQYLLNTFNRNLGTNDKKYGLKDFKIFVSEQGHYAKENVANWTGIGAENVIQIPTDKKNRMDTEILKKKLEEYKDHPSLIVCTMGSTDSFSFDDVAAIREYIDDVDNYPNQEKRPMIYADSVVGWCFLMFKDYNFEKNELEFPNEVKEWLLEGYRQVKNIKDADVFSIDFHKTGYSAYASSMVVFKEYDKFKYTVGRETAPYLDNPVFPYSPYNQTLECSRNASGALSAYATLKLFGKQGFRTIFGSLIDNVIKLRKEINSNENFVVVNDSNQGFVTLFKVFPQDTQNAKRKFEIIQKDMKYDAWIQKLKSKTSKLLELEKKNSLTTEELSVQKKIKEEIKSLEEKLEGIIGVEYHLNRIEESKRELEKNNEFQKLVIAKLWSDVSSKSDSTPPLLTTTTLPGGITCIKCYTLNPFAAIEFYTYMIQYLKNIIVEVEKDIDHFNYLSINEEI